jgi:hypothetical protein
MRVQPNVGLLREELAGYDLETLGPTGLLEVLRRIRARHDIKELLSKIIGCPALLQEMSSHSYSHNNGCDKFVIDSMSEFGIKLRLHVWWEKINSESESNVHDHPWHFASNIIVGTLRMRRYAESPCITKEYVAASYPTLAAPLGTRCVNVKGTAALLRVAEEEFGAGEFYVLCCSDLHSVVVSRRVTATIVLQGKHELQQTRVYARTSDDLLNPFSIRYFTQEEIAAKLSRLNSLLP